MPGDVSFVLNAARVHREGVTGKAINVAMVDTGFYSSHAYFQERGYNMSVILAPRATAKTEDGHGHGTAECANIFAVAPDITFIGIKLRNEADPAAGATLAEGFKVAVAQNPDIITVSIGHDLADPVSRQHFTSLPHWHRPLEAEVKAAVQGGIIVVFAAGNGHVAFPGMLPEVISVGGTFVGEQTDREASDYASAFPSRIYPGRHVPNVTGLVGLNLTDGNYIMLPVQPGCEMDRDRAGNPRFQDGTKPDDGWVVISGTSAAAPQIAGICALLKQKNPELTPHEAKNVLERTARDVLRGHANPLSNQGSAVNAGPGAKGAAGHGLADAFAAWRQV
jgi:subtilisin family serine protease